MSECSCEFPHAAVWSRSLRGVVLAAVLLFCGGLRSVMLAVEKAQAESAFSGGPCRLVVREAKQDRWPSKEDRWIVQLQFQLEFPSAVPPIMAPLMPENYFLLVRESPLVAAYLPGEKRNIAKQEHLSAAPGGALVLVANLHVGKARPRLERVEVALEVARITDWETREFALDRGDNSVRSFGPFEIKAWGELRAVRVEIGEYPEFKNARAEYRRTMPLPFLNQSYGETALRLVDAAGRQPNGFSMAKELGSSPDWKRTRGVTEYSSWFSPTAPAAGDAVSYPVRASAKLPKTYTTETVRFSFATIELPLPENAR